MNSPKRNYRSKSPAKSPKKSKGNTIVDIALSNPNFSTLVELLEKADLVSELRKRGSMTVFAPTNKAFAKLDKKVVEHLMSPEGAKDLKDILLYHVLNDKVTSGQIEGPMIPRTLQGKNLCVYLKNGVKINDGKLIQADIQASNGVIHVIDTKQKIIKSLILYLIQKYIVD
jgi:uncharacterized surface protein with fasciclin (FAS1) repeats